MKLSSGFTLIETLIYLALFSIIIGGVLVAAYQIIQASTVSQENALIQEEGNFLVAKINWALTGATTINQPASGNSGNTLNLDKVNYANNPINFTVSGTELAFQAFGQPVFVLNSDSVKIKNINFIHIAPVGGKPAAVQATFRVTSKLTGKSHVFSTTKYLRK